LNASNVRLDWTMGIMEGQPPRRLSLVLSGPAAGLSVTEKEHTKPVREGDITTAAKYGIVYRVALVAG